MTRFIMAGGCFWCLDAVFQRIRGVIEVESGYTGGQTTNPTYENVCTGDTGHAEAVAVTFDESIVTADTILDIFFLIHDPTSLNRQGADVGTQYRSALFPEDDDQTALFKQAMARAEVVWKKPLVTTIEPLETFYRAEEYHQDFFNKNPDSGYCQIVIEPKISKARQAYAHLWV